MDSSIKNTGPSHHSTGKAVTGDIKEPILRKASAPKCLFPTHLDLGRGKSWFIWPRRFGQGNKPIMTLGQIWSVFRSINLQQLSIEATGIFFPWRQFSRKFPYVQKADAYSSSSTCQLCLLPSWVRDCEDETDGLTDMLLNYNWPQSITAQAFCHLNCSDYLLSRVFATVLHCKRGEFGAFINEKPNN